MLIINHKKFNFNNNNNNRLRYQINKFKITNNNNNNNFLNKLILNNLLAKSLHNNLIKWIIIILVPQILCHFMAILNKIMGISSKYQVIIQIHPEVKLI